MRDGKTATANINKYEDYMKPPSFCHVIVYIHWLFSVASQKDIRRQSKGKL